MPRVAILGGHGKTGKAVAAGLAARGVRPVSVGRSAWADLPAAISGCGAAYIIAPNLHPDEPAYVHAVLEACAEAGVARVVYHSVAWPYAPAMPHHLGKAASEDVIHRSRKRWTVLQSGAYLQNLDLTGPVRVPYDVHAPFGFLDLADLGRVAATVLLEPGHEFATYELATRLASVAELAREAGVSAERVAWTPDETLDARQTAWLAAMFAFYDRHGLPVSPATLRSLLCRAEVGRHDDAADTRSR